MKELKPIKEYPDFIHRIEDEITELNDKISKAIIMTHPKSFPGSIRDFYDLDDQIDKMREYKLCLVNRWTSLIQEYCVDQSIEIPEEELKIVEE